MYPLIYGFIIGLKTTYFDVSSILADSKLHIFGASRIQNYIFNLPNGLRTIYCGLRTTYLPVENFVLKTSRHMFFNIMDSKLHIDGFKATYFHYFADSKLHICIVFLKGFREPSVSFIGLHNLTGKRRVRRKNELRVC